MRSAPVDGSSCTVSPLETEAVLLEQHSRRGGELVRLHVERAEPLGGFTGWTPARAVSQWSIVKGDS